MKIKKKQGPGIFIDLMKFKVENPRVHKLIVRHARLLLQAELMPWKRIDIDPKVEKIRKEIERLIPAIDLEKYPRLIRSYQENRDHSDDMTPGSSH